MLDPTTPAAGDPQDPAQVAPAPEHAAAPAAEPDVMPPAGPRQPSAWERALSRRVPQILGLYVGAATSAVLFTEFLTARYALSPYLVDVLLAAVVLALPAVAVLAYTHGAPVHQRWSWRQVGALGANGLLGLGVLAAAFWGKPLGATTETVSVETADGETVQRTVAKAAFRERVAVADFGGDAALGPAVGYALVRDLRQDLFVTAYGAGALRRPLREAGFETSSQAPVPLVKEAARDFLSDVVVTGTVERSPRGFRLSAALHPVGRPGAPSRYNVEGPSLLRLIDDLSVQIRAGLDLPEGHQAEDRAVEDLLTGSADALAAWGAGHHAQNYLDAPEDAVAHFRRAVALDSTFATAYATLGETLRHLARGDESLAAFRAGQRHRYRLTESDRFRLDTQIANAEQRPEDALSTVREWASFYPDDVDAQMWLAAYAAYGGETEEALGAYRRLVEIDPSNPLRHYQLAVALYNEERYEEGRAEVESYIAEAPDDPDGYTLRATFEATGGDFEAATASVNRAIRLDPTDPQHRLTLAGYQYAAGEWDHAEAGYRRVAAEAAEPAYVGGALQLLAHVYDAQGQLAKAAETLDQAWEAYEPTTTRVALLATKLQEGYHYTRAGRTGDFETMMAQALAQPEAQTGLAYRGRIAVGAAYAYAQTGQVERSLRYAATADSSYAAYGSAEGKPFVNALRGLAEVQRGRWDRAAALLAPYAQDNPAPSEYTFALAEALLRAGETERAREVAGGLRVRAPGHPRPRLVLAQLDARRDPAAARRHLNVALVAWADADAGFEPARRARALRQRLAAG